MSRTFRLRHLPSLGAKKFVDGRLGEYEDEVDEELYRDLAHEWYNFPCVKDTSTQYWSIYGQRWLTKHCKSHEECLERGMVGFGSSSMAPYRFFRKMRRRTPRQVATVWSHPWVGMKAGMGLKKSHRVRKNRDYRRVMRAAEVKTLCGDEDVLFPVYKKSVLWDLW